MADAGQLGRRLSFKQLPGLRRFSWFVPTMALVGLIALLGITDVALTRPDINVWVRLIDVAVGVGLAALCVWFGVATKRAILSRAGYLEMRDDSIAVYDSALFDRPWEVPIRFLRGVAIDPRAREGLGWNLTRFPIVSEAASGRESRFAPWLFSWKGGSPLPMLGGKLIPNVALFFRSPLRMDSLRRRAGLSVFATEYGPAGADRPRPNMDYPGLLMAIEDAESFRRWCAGKGLLVHEISSADAEAVGATIERERSHRKQVIIVIGLAVLALIVGILRIRAG